MKKRNKVISILAAIAAIAVLVIFGVSFFVFKSHSFHEAVLRKLVEEGQLATGGRLQVQNWDLHIRPLTFDLYGIVLHGTEPQGFPPLLQADKLTVGLDANALLHRRLQLSELLIQHPVANVQVGNNGQSNIPSKPAGTSTSNTSVWSLAVQHTLLSHGEVSYNDRKISLDADLYDLNTDIRFDAGATRYAGTLSYRDGRLRYASYSSLRHALKAKFSATPSGASLSSLLLQVGSSQVSLRGQLVNYQSPDVNATYEFLIHTQDFASYSPEVRPAGDLQITGGMRYQDANQPLLRRLSVTGNLASSDLQTSSPQGRVALRNLKAQYDLANGNLQVHNLGAEIVGGLLNADLSVRGLDRTPEGTVRASLRQASIELVRRSSSQNEIRRMPVTGMVDVGVRGTWAGSLKNIRLLGDAALRAAVWEESAPRKIATPVDGVVHLTYDGSQNELTLHQTTLRIPSTSVVLDGRLGDYSDLQVHAVAGDLHRLSELLSSLRSIGSGTPSPKIDVSGNARLDAVVQGSIQKPHISGQFSAQDLMVQGSPWKEARLNLQASPSQISLQQGSLISGQQGDLHFSAQVQLENWSYQPSNGVTANLVARDMSIAELEHLANVQYPLSGNLSAHVDIHGSQLHPEGHGSLQIVRANAYNQPIRNLAAQFRTEKDTIQSQVNLDLPAGSASANVNYTPKTKAYKFDLHTAGIVLQNLQAVSAKNLPVAGTLIASGSGQGTLDQPQLALNLEIPRLKVRDTSMNQLQAQLNVENQRAKVTLSSSVTQAFVRAHATVDLVGNYNAQATIDTSKVPLDPFLAVYASAVPAAFHGETELHATLNGPLKDKSRLAAHVTIPTLNGSYQSLQFSNAAPIRIDYANSEIVLQPAEIRGTDTSLRVEGRVPLSNAGMTLEAQGSVNLGLISMFSSDVKSAGAVDLNIRGRGTIRNPAIEGKLQIKNAALSTSNAPIALSKLNGVLDVTKDSVQITDLTGEMGGGQITAGGSIAFAPSVVFNVALRGKSIHLLYPEGVRTVLDSNLAFTGNMQEAYLRGRALVDSLNFTPDFDVANFASQFGGPSVPPLNEGFADNVKLAVAVQSAQNLQARSSQLSLEGAANLQVEGTASNPVIVGRIDLTSGELFFMNNRYQLQRGIITFDDPTQTRPTLNVQATTIIEQYNITLTLMGPLDRLTTNYVSDPALPATDIISLIYRGQTVAQASAAGTSTDALLASQAASRLSSGIQKFAGISSLQIDPLLGANNTNPSARIAIQQRVTKDFLFTFSTDVTQPQAEIVQGEYQLTKHWSVSVERDEVGGISIDGRYHTKF